MKLRRAIIILLLGLVIRASGASTYSQEKESDTEVLRKQRLEIYEVCAATLGNIQRELTALEKTFSMLKGISASKLLIGKPYDSITKEFQRIDQHLAFRKKVRVERLKPDSRGFMQMIGEKDVIENNGAIINVYLVESPFGVNNTQIYVLPVTSKYGTLSLVYYLETNPVDTNLAMAVEKLMEKNVASLSNAVLRIATNGVSQFN